MIICSDWNKDGGCQCLSPHLLSYVIQAGQLHMSLPTYVYSEKQISELKFNDSRLKGFKHAIDLSDLA